MVGGAVEPDAVRLFPELSGERALLRNVAETGPGRVWHEEPVFGLPRTGLCLGKRDLDVVQHLLDLENPPDPDLFDQVFEVFSGLFSLSARLGVERADQAQRARALEIVDQLQGDELPIGAVHERIHALSDLFVEASGNMVLAMVRKGVKTRFIDRHEALLAPPSPERPELLERLARAIADGDGPAAANAIFDITQVVRQGAVESLRAEREQLAEPSKAGAATR